MTIYGKMTHPLHRHGLKLEREETPYFCNGCGEVGFNTRYACKKGCNFHLHKDCATPQEVITHPFFPRCQFHFLQSPPSGRRRYCDACGRDIKGFVYHCFEKGWDLHPCCEALAREKEVGPEEAKATLVLHRVSSSTCNWCGKKELEKGVKTWTYVSACKECHLHVACAKEMLLEKWEVEHLGHGKVAAKAGRKDSLAVKAGRKDSLAVKAEGKDSLALKISEPTTQIVPQKKKSKWGKFAKFKKIVQIAITFIMAAVVGDPTALVAGLIASLIAH